MNRRISVTLLLGFASGLPLALTSSTLQAWFAVSSISLKEIGLLGIVGLPYTFKFLWAPLLDRWVPPLLGRRRGWIFLFQGLIAISVALMGLFNPSEHLNLLFVLACLVAFFSASQDIVIDAYRSDVLLPKERPLGAAMSVNGYRVAMLVSGGLALVFADWLGWQTTYSVMAVLIGIGMIVTILGPEPSASVTVPRNLSECIVDPFTDFFKRKKAIGVLLFIVFYKLGDAFAGTLTQTFLIREVGMSLTSIGVLVKLLGFLGTVLGTTAGALGVSRLGWFRSLWLFGVLQSASNLLYLTLLWIGPNDVVAGFSIFVENFCAGMGTAAFVGLLMGLCSAKFSAFQYALLSSLSAVGRVFIGPVAGVIAERYGWIDYFLVSVIFSVPGLLLLSFLKGDIFAMTRQSEEGLVVG